MAKRFSVQADTREECIEGFDELCSKLSLVPLMLPQRLTDSRWMARAVPAPQAAAEQPAE
ncbi:hypothetical protein ACFCYB_00195 [Streptomyces sp. NPDC056309]|uniref:hypothetical protein n=1 Tax=Streptomyces sp. NPDC056309 TaxID=3345781 RepID=UPI0035D9CAA7